MASFDRRHAEAVAAEFARQPLGASVLLVEADIAGLPAPVKRYIRASGAIGHPRPQNVRVAFDALMRRKPGADPMVSTSVQYNFFGQPARLFLMRARMFGVPVRALHLYRREAATFQVRVLDLKTIVDQAGPGISAAESVTVLNDWCFMAPGALVDERLAWQPIDDHSARVTFTNEPYQVSATLIFNERNELVDFWSDDRPDSSAGAFVTCRWNTPIGEYRDLDGMRLPTWGGAVWNRAEGPFMYGEFRLRSLRYDVLGPAE
ncbi:MAG TPA: DUF6544 family protein [Terriglobales bacterium]|nr:DUF6544 family protein [Terriglobales bacterium]